MIACPTCARGNPDDFVFCPGCGTRLADDNPAEAKGLTEERKVVSTLFCDLVSYTAHSEANDHELIDALLQRYSALAKKLVERHGGVVEKFIGDAVLAVFGFPRAHDDDAERAVRCGMLLIESAGELTWPDGDPVQVRVGVNSGETFLHTDVDPASGETFLTGDAVNTAARLQTAAPPAGLVVGALTHELTEQAIGYAELEPLAVKGKREPVGAWLAKSAREVRSRTGLRTTGKLDTPFLGRDSELQSLEAAIDMATSERRAQVRLVVGEPGIGKSRLVLEFARALDHRPEPITWRQGRCLAFGEGVAFWALGEIIKRHAAILDSDDVAIVEAKLEAVLPDGDERPWFSQRLRPLLGLEGSQSTQEESFAAWTQFLCHLATSSPTVLVFEDLHWAGEGMLAFLEHLASQDLGVSLLIVGTSRPELLAKHPDLLRAADGVGHLVLAPLTRREASRLVSVLFHQRLASDVRSTIMERVGGNPLYAEEYVRLLLDRDLLVTTKGALRLKKGEELPLPETVQAVLAARLDTLPGDHKALLCDAAVFGESFWGGGVARLAQRTPEEVAAAMASLAERQLVRRTVSSSLEGESAFLFWHALARDVAYEQLPRRARARKHEEAALWIEAAAGGRASDVAEVLAHHYASALDLSRTLRDEALAERLKGPTGRHLAAAGEKTLPLDVGVALAYYKRALEALPADDPERAKALYYQAEALSWQGQRQEGIAAYEEAAKAYQAAGDRNMAALSLIELSEFLGNDGDPRSRPLFERSLTLLDEEHPSRALVLALSEAAGMQLAYRGPAAAIEAANRALKVAEKLGLPASPFALEWRAAARSEMGEEAGAREDLRRAIEEGEAQGIGGELCRVYNNLAAVTWQWQGPHKALEVLLENAERARLRGMTFWELTSHTSTISALTDVGRWDEALAKISEWEPRVEASGYAEHMVNLRLNLALMLAVRGAFAEAEGAVGWLVEVARRRGMPPVNCAACLAVAAYARSLEERLDEAHALLVEISSIMKEGEISSLPFLPLFVQSALSCGDLSLATRYPSPDAAVPVDEVAAHGVSAMLAEARGDLETASSGFARAASRAHDLGMLFDEAQALLGQARCLAALGGATEAAPLLARARGAFLMMGAEPALCEVDSLASS